MVEISQFPTLFILSIYATIHIGVGGLRQGAAALLTLQIVLKQPYLGEKSTRNLGKDTETVFRYFREPPHLEV